MDISFEKAALEDAAELISVQNQSFYADYLKYGLCPGYNHSLEQVTKNISSRFVFKILCDGRVVGDIIVREDGNGDYHLCCLCVIPDFENRGIGQLALKFLYEQFPESKHWSLETPTDKLRNHYFYKKHGFKVTKQYDVSGVPISYFEKSQ